MRREGGRCFSLTIAESLELVVHAESSMNGWWAAVLHGTCSLAYQLGVFVRSPFPGICKHSELSLGLCAVCCMLSLGLFRRNRFYMCCMHLPCCKLLSDFGQSFICLHIFSKSSSGYFPSRVIFYSNLTFLGCFRH